MKDIILLLVILLSGIPQVLSAEFYDALAELTIVWPLPGQTAESPLFVTYFGPRYISTSAQPYSFHPGIDIAGSWHSPVLASLPGTVVKVVTSPLSGHFQVQLEHEFGQTVQFHDHNVTKFYTIYFPLESISVAENDTVAAGQEIGKLGDDDAADDVHLHQEIRVGTQCTLEQALTRPKSTCITLGVDPHVNPLLFYPETIIGASALTTSLKQRVGSNRDGVVLIEAPATRPDANRFVVQVYGKNRMTKYILDLNLRIGFDATSKAALDTLDKSKPFLDPVESSSQMMVFQTKLVVPHAWVPDDAKRIVVTVYNIMNEKAAGTVVLCRGNGAMRCNRAY